MEAKQQGAKQWQIHKSQNNKSFNSLFQQICIANKSVPNSTYVMCYLGHFYLGFFETLLFGTLFETFFGTLLWNSNNITMV